MPRKRTHGKRKLDPYSGAEAWSDVFQTGYATFDDFTDLTGVELEPRSLPNGAPTQRLAPALSDSEAAWQAYGPAFLTLYDHETSRGEMIWALRQFGEPTDAR